jgi:alpha-tubulin suppressor-like RCC1 family protein
MGRDDYGQTGRGSGGGEDGGPHTNAQVVMRLHPTTLGTYELKEVSQVDVGLHHACAVVGSDRRVYCRGRNDYGALGRGHTLTRWEETLAHYPVDKASGGVLTGVVEVAVGGYHTCARTTDARVYCWGWQGEGRLGNGAHAYVAQATALEVSTTFARVRKLSLGTNHSCAIAAQAGATSDSVYCWGYGASGQVGGSTVAVNTSLVRVFQSSGAVTDLSAGDSTTCAIDAGALKCWGANDRGQLGIGATGAGNATPQTIGTASDNASIGPTGTYQPRQVSVGRAHACGLFHSASGVKVMCWGSNASWDGVATGQVGNNSTANATRPQTSISRSICVQ